MSNGGNFANFGTSFKYAFICVSSKFLGRNSLEFLRNAYHSTKVSCMYQLYGGKIVHPILKSHYKRLKVKFWDHVNEKWRLIQKLCNFILKKRKDSSVAPKINYSVPIFSFTLDCVAVQH